MNILLAEDDTKTHLIINMWLQKNDHWVEFAHNGKQALEKLYQGGFDCLITDVNMPLMNGVELVKEALKLPSQPELIVVLTSRCDIPQLRAQLSSPKVHLLNKPFSPTQLVEIIQKLSSPSTTKP